MHVVTSLDCGGLERVVVALVREGQRLGQRVAVVCLDHPGTLAAQVEGMGATLMCAHKPPGVKLVTAKRLAGFMREFKPDVVHTHEIGSAFYAGLAVRRAGGLPIVHTEHGRNFGANTRLRIRLLGKLAGWFVRRFFCVSEDIAAHVVEQRIVSGRKVSVVRNGIDTATFRDGDGGQAVRGRLGIAMDAPVIGTVGRLNEVKRQDVLIRGFAELRRTVPEVHLVLVGDGPLMGELRQLTNELGLGGCVHFAGYQANPEEYLKAMNVFALTSRSEGMPLVVLEAWAAGVPVITSRVGGLPELIAEGETGLMFEMGDEGALAAGLRSLVEDAALALRLRENSRRYVEERYDVSVMARQYEEHYRELVSVR